MLSEYDLNILKTLLLTIIPLNTIIKKGPLSWWEGNGKT
jgi:hypothetical protein